MVSLSSATKEEQRKQVFSSKGMRHIVKETQAGGVLLFEVVIADTLDDQGPAIIFKRPDPDHVYGHVPRASERAQFHPPSRTSRWKVQRHLRHHARLRRSLASTEGRTQADRS